MNPPNIPTTQLKIVEADGLKIFYREAGPADGPVLLLLHGFPTSSHMFRHLMPRLAPTFRVIAPDLPGFGFTEVPAGRNYDYRFDNLAVTTDAFVQKLNLTRYALYVFDYGAPTGYRLAVSHPDKVVAIISQNGNAYLDGLGDAWDPIKKYWKDPTQANREALREFVDFEGTKFQYVHGVADPLLVEPESYWLDTALLRRPGNVDIQLGTLHVATGRSDHLGGHITPDKFADQKNARMTIFCLLLTRRRKSMSRRFACAGMERPRFWSKISYRRRIWRGY